MSKRANSQINHVYYVICELNLMKLRELRTEVVQRYYECEQTRKFANLITCIM